MVATAPLRHNWKRARQLRKAAKQVEKALWRKDGYGIGKRFNTSDSVSEDLYKKASEILGSLEAAARILEGRKL